MKLHVCCGDGAVFDSNYQQPSGYAKGGNGNALISDIDFSADDGYGVKEIAVFIICGLLVIGCCGFGFWRLYRCHMEMKTDKVINTVIAVD